MGLVPFLAGTLLPPGFDGIILLAAISAALSTMSAIVLVATTLLTSDILRYLHPEISDKKTLLLTRIVGVTILLIAAISAVDVPQQIVPLASVSMGVIACCVFVPLIFGLYWDRGTQTGFIASLLASFFSVSRLELLRQPFHSPRIHRSHLRHGGLTWWEVWRRAAPVGGRRH